MSGIAKVWLFFVGTRLFLTTHFNNVTKECAYMVYSILTSGLFDAGIYISCEIVKVALGQCGGSKGGLWFPSLITQLCRKACVPMKSREMLCEDYRS